MLALMSVCTHDERNVRNYTSGAVVFKLWRTLLGVHHYINWE